MNVMIYALKQNFEVQKAERYFKERRIPFVKVDLKKHKLGERELELFCRAAGGAKKLFDTAAKGERADYVRVLNNDDMVFDELLEHPELIKTPIVRNGNKVTVGFDQSAYETWE